VLPELEVRASALRVPEWWEPAAAAAVAVPARSAWEPAPEEEWSQAGPAEAAFGESFRTDFAAEVEESAAGRRVASPEELAGVAAAASAPLPVKFPKRRDKI
jgi:hypothetical protein